jgi:hypothetical protein
VKILVKSTKMFNNVKEIMTAKKPVTLWEKNLLTLYWRFSML